MGLSDTPAKSLDKFIEDHLLPNEEFGTQVKEAIDIICTFLKERCFRYAPHRVRVSKVVKVSPELPGWGEGGLVCKCLHRDSQRARGWGLWGWFWFIHARTITTSVKIASRERASICKFLTNSLGKCITHLGHDCFGDKQSESWQHLQFTNLYQGGISLFLQSLELVKSICFESR